MATTTAAERGTTTWTIDPAHTSVEFAVRHIMISTVKGRFADVSGTVTTQGDDPATARIDVTIQAASVDTRQEQRDTHLRSADFFEVEKFPTLTYVSRKVTRTGTDTLHVEGDLTIHGVTRPVDLEVEDLGRHKDPWGGDRAGFAAKGKLSREAFGLTWNQALETGGMLLSDEVKLSIDVQLVKKVG